MAPGSPDVERQRQRWSWDAVDLIVAAGVGGAVAWRLGSAGALAAPMVLGGLHLARARIGALVLWLASVGLVGVPLYFAAALRRLSLEVGLEVPWPTERLLDLAEFLGSLIGLVPASALLLASAWLVLASGHGRLPSRAWTLLGASLAFLLVAAVVLFLPLVKWCPERLD